MASPKTILMLFVPSGLSCMVAVELEGILYSLFNLMDTKKLALMKIKN